ncbi:hypothetical protein PHYBOEH_004985 [Phytophthora boehmeriae]|uniref:PH domain-containing protein n=1 Tax=Phytophthora boehmeriae TaxID=109152 RepID=A0A8T1WS78_9STRA|nr:hypothetical protein PHYBOEH_004985 [Phytophthora boehmeriae]
MIEFFPTLLSQRDLWMEAFSSRVDFARGEALLADEKIMMRLERDDEDAVDEAHVDKENESSGDNEASDDDDNDKSRESGTEEKFLPPLVMELPSETPRENEDDYMAHSFAFRAAAMEGILIPWQTSTSPIRLPGSSKMKPMAEVYAVLIGHRLCCYGSKESAAAASAATSVRNLTYADDVSPSLDVEVTSCSSWDAPTATWLPINKEKEGLGLKIEVKSSRHGVCFTAPTLEMKLQWLHVLKHELDFVRAERSMSVAELQFTREVAEHLAATAAKAEANQDASAPASSTETKTEGYLRVRHHNLGSVWRDRFVVLDGSKLSIYSNESDAGVDQESDESTPSTALEKHEVVGVEKWHPVFTSKGRSGTGSLKGTGFRIMTSSSIYLECTAISEDEASRWRVAISAATTKEFSDSITTRDSTLPFIPGARMEGYIKLKDPATSKKTVKMKAVKQWKTRYCVVMGSHWLVYANQAQAISSGEAPTPVAVYELVSVTPVEGDDDDSATKFHLHVIPDKRVKCRASSSLERKRWMNAVEDELQTEAKTSEDLARSVKEREEKQAARNAVKTKMHEMKSDARRLSELLGQALQSAQDDSDYESDSDEGILDDAEGGGKQVLQRSRSDYLDGSPESSPMRRRESAFPFDTLDVTKSSKERDTLQPSALGGCFACFFRCIPIRASHGRSTVAPLGIPGYPSTAAACNPQYTCDYYEDDGYRGLTD